MLNLNLKNKFCFIALFLVIFLACEAQSSIKKTNESQGSSDDAQGSSKRENTEFSRADSAPAGYVFSDASGESIDEPIVVTKSNGEGIFYNNNGHTDQIDLTTFTKNNVGTLTYFLKGPADTEFEKLESPGIPNYKTFQPTDSIGVGLIIIKIVDAGDETTEQKAIYFSITYV